MKVQRISSATVARLPSYVECLSRFAERGTIVVSSRDLAELAGVSAAQLRKDLSYLGDFGMRGTGYHVASLLRHIAHYIGLTREWRVAIVGYGKLGSALANYSGLNERNYRVVAAFDLDPAKVGRRVGDFEVYPMDALRQVVAEKRIDMAIIATPARVAQQVANLLVAAGIRSILSFAPAPLLVPADVTLREVDLATEVQILSFYETLRETRTPKERSPEGSPQHYTFA